jgi:hypothetical protein
VRIRPFVHKLSTEEWAQTQRIPYYSDFLVFVRKQMLSRLTQSCQHSRRGKNVPLLWAFQTVYLTLFSRLQCFRLACHCCLCLLVLKDMHFPQTSPQPQNFRYSDQELYRHQLCSIDQQYQSTPNTTLSPSHVHFPSHPATFFGQSL